MSTAKQNKSGYSKQQFTKLLDDALGEDNAVAKIAMNELKKLRYSLPEHHAKVIFMLLSGLSLNKSNQPDNFIRLLIIVSFSKTSMNYSQFLAQSALDGLEHKSGAVRENARKLVDNLPFSFQSKYNNEQKHWIKLLYKVESLIKKYQPDNPPYELLSAKPSVYKSLCLTWYDMMEKYRLYEKLNYDERMEELGIPMYDSRDYLEEYSDGMTGYIPACEYPELQPFLSRSIPLIELKYFQAPDDGQRAKMAQESDTICAECGHKVAVLGTIDRANGEVTCDICAINNYKEQEGFITIKAAEAHRRRLFDTGYLLTEMIIDRYLDRFCITIDQLNEEENFAMAELSQNLQNDISKTQKIELQNQPDQAIIERYYNNLIDHQPILPTRRFF